MPDTLQPSAAPTTLPTVQTCRLLSGFFSIFVQGALGVLALCTLYIKWRCETPRRRFWIWAMDVSKQAVAGLVAHGCNMLFAILLTIGIADADECAFYFLNFVADTVLGVPTAWALLKGLEIVARRRGWDSLKRTGYYGVDASDTGFADFTIRRAWLLQLFSWTCILFITKSLLVLPLWAMREQLSLAGSVLFSPLEGNPKLELFLVMILAPCICNAVQFWVFDYVLAAGPTRGSNWWRCCSCRTPCSEEDLLLDTQERRMDYFSTALVPAVEDDDRNSQRNRSTLDVDAMTGDNDNDLLTRTDARALLSLN